MQPLLQEWKIYGKLSDDVTLMTVRFGYCMEHSKPVVLSLEALKSQVQDLQVNSPGLGTALYWQVISRGSKRSHGHNCVCALNREAQNSILNTSIRSIA